MSHALRVTRSVDVALLPSEALVMGGDCFVVVDVLRATTTAATLFAAGLADLVVVASIDEARRRATSEGRLVAGEVQGRRPDGFDYGNSPVEATKAPVAGRGAVLFTTNGTAALCALSGSGSVITGAIANVSATARYADRFERVVVVCAGNERGQRFSLEDFAAAGAICRVLSALNPDRVAGDAATFAMTVPTEAIARSEHAALLRDLGFGDDTDFALLPDSSSAVPVVTESGEGWALLKDASLGR